MLTIYMTYADDRWKLHAVEPGVDSEGTSIEEAFDAFFEALADQKDAAPILHVVGDHAHPAPGMYCIRVTQLDDGRLMARSTDILGLTLAGEATEVMEQLPGRVKELLAAQREDFLRVT